MAVLLTIVHVYCKCVCVCVVHVYKITIQVIIYVHYLCTFTCSFFSYILDVFSNHVNKAIHNHILLWLNVYTYKLKFDTITCTCICNFQCCNRGSSESHGSVLSQEADRWNPSRSGLPTHPESQTGQLYSNQTVQVHQDCALVSIDHQDH